MDGSCWKILPPDKANSGYRTVDWLVDPSVSGIERLTPEQRWMLNLLSGQPEILASAFALPNSVTVKQAKIGFAVSNQALQENAGATAEAKAATVRDRIVDFVNNSLNRVYISDILVEHVLGTIDISMTSNGDPYGGTGQGLLSVFRDHWNSDSELSDHDLAYLYTNQSIDALGWAFVGQVGNRSRYGMGNGLGGVARHEISHIWAMGHGNGCQLEFKPGGTSFDVGMCGGEGSRANSNESGIARGHRNSRSNGVLDDIGSFPTPQPPYCPLDNYSTLYGGSAIILDVLANDFDANNDPFEIKEIRNANQDNVVITETVLGAQVSISPGTGPGGRDQILYTPPAASTTVDNIDQFLYIVQDQSGSTSFGNVRVTLNPNISPEPLSPLAYIADSSEQWSDENNPNGLWSYGSVTDGTSDLVLASSLTTDDAVLVGGDGTSWAGNDSARVSQFTQQPGDTVKAVRRWKSNFFGPAVIEYTVSKLEIPLSDPNATPTLGETSTIALNGQTLWTQSLMAGDIFSGRLSVNLVQNDVLDMITDSNGDRETDGVYFHVRVLPAYQVNEDASLLFHFPLDEGSTDPDSRRKRATDISGNNHHATADTSSTNELWQPGQIANCLTINGTDQRLILDESGLGDGTSELTLSIWFKADRKRLNAGMLTCDGDYFGLLFRGEDGTPLEFRAHSNSLTANDSGISAPLGKWTHAVGVWKSGEFQKIYVNGEEIASTTSTSSGPTSGITKWYIGSDRNNSGRYHEGQLDDAAVWTRALSAGEIRAMHALGRSQRNFRDDEDDTYVINTSPVKNGSSELTLSAWIKPTSLSNNDGFVTTGSIADPNYFALLSKGVSGRPLEFRGNNSSLFNSVVTPPLDELIHIAGTWKSGETQHLYLNGREVASSVANSTTPQFNTWAIGQDRDINNRLFEGSISEVLITGRAFNAAQIREIYSRYETSWSASHGFITSVDGIGTAGIPRLREASGILTLTSAGTGVAGTSDAFTFASRKHTGAVDFSAQVLGNTNTLSAGQTGIMIRNSLAPNATYAHLYRDETGNVILSTRTSTGSNTNQIVSSPAAGVDGTYFRLIRAGNTVTAETSFDGATYTEVGTTNINLNEDVYIGLTHASGHGSDQSASQFEHVLLDPSSLDMDMDGLPDAWEITHFCNLTSTSGMENEDFDKDGLSDSAEFQAGTSPVLADTDGDGANDSDEVLIHDSDPLNQDTDGDGLTDGQEINEHRSDPNLVDSDQDGVDDLIEVNFGTSPGDSFQIPLLANPEQLKSHWKFDETSNSALPGRAENSADSNHHAWWRDSNGNNTTGLTWTTGIVGGAARLSAGEADKFFVRNDPLAGSDEITISCWFDIERTAAYEGIISMRSASNQDNWGMGATINSIDFRFDDNGFRSPNLIFVEEGWYHLALTWKREGGQSQLRGYVNGELVVDKMQSAPTSYNTVATQDWRFGDDNGGRWREIQASLDEFAMFSKALSPTEIAVIHNAGRNGISVDNFVSYPAARIVESGRDGNTVTLRFESEAGADYTVYTSDDLSKPYSEWTPLPGILQGSGGMLTFTDNSVSSPKQFYVVRTNPLNN